MRPPLPTTHEKKVPFTRDGLGMAIGATPPVAAAAPAARISPSRAPLCIVALRGGAATSPAAVGARLGPRLTAPGFGREIRATRARRSFRSHTACGHRANYCSDVVSIQPARLYVAAGRPVSILDEGRCSLGA